VGWGGNRDKRCGFGWREVGKEWEEKQWVKWWEEMVLGREEEWRKGGNGRQWVERRMREKRGNGGEVAIKAGEEARKKKRGSRGAMEKVENTVCNQREREPELRCWAELKMT
jgi:hypothetical protein